MGNFLGARRPREDEDSDASSLGEPPAQRRRLNKPQGEELEELYNAIDASTDKLFFVAFAGPESSRPKWNLVAADLVMTDEAELDPRADGVYYCHFYSPADKDGKFYSHPDCRWWPIWHEYTTDDDGVINFGKQYLIRPNTIPDPDEYVAWAENLDLSDDSVRLVGPFDFVEPHKTDVDRTPSFRQMVPTNLWKQLSSICSHRGMDPPRMTARRSPPKSAKKPAKKKGSSRR